MTRSPDSTFFITVICVIRCATAADLLRSLLYNAYPSYAWHVDHHRTRTRTAALRSLPRTAHACTTSCACLVLLVGNAIYMAAHY